jgi:hypothetical protein
MGNGVESTFGEASPCVKYSLTQRMNHQDKAYEQQPCNTSAFYSFTDFLEGTGDSACYYGLAQMG